MATTQDSKVETPTLSKESQERLTKYVQLIMETWRMRADLSTKLEEIDKAYVRYHETGQDSEVECDVFESDRVTPPIVVSQVDSIKAYLAEVFLSGYPIFPVVSSPNNRADAEKLEVLLDDHAIIGSYPRHLLQFIGNAVKYNYGPIELDWAPVNQFSVEGDFMNTDTGKKVAKRTKNINKIRALDPYNTVIDLDVPPGDVSEEGDYAGYVDVLSYVKLKRLIARMAQQYKVYNLADILYKSQASGAFAYYTNKPDINKYVSSKRRGEGFGSFNWDTWVAGGKKRSAFTSAFGYEIVKMYVRIIPSDFKINAPQSGTAQIWQVILVNNCLLSAERLISAYDQLPIMVGQPLEDGFGFQTQSIAEGEMEFQDAAAKLFNVRFSAARRAVSDRALYVTGMIDPNDVNSKAAAPKIPVRLSALANMKLTDVYQQIPFDMRGTETAISDAQQIVQFSKELHGQNSPRQGQFQRGNKSVREWVDTMSGSEERLRMYALALEYQVFSSLKSMMIFNIFRDGEDTKIVSQRTGEVVEINLDELRKKALAFRVADGYSPKSKLANTEMLTTGMQILGTSPVLQQTLGTMLPGMFVHLMSLGGVRNLEQYLPPQLQQPQTTQAPNTPQTTGAPAQGATGLPTP